MRRCDVAIVGAGIGGASLATALAREGLDVVVLESSTEYEDRVRGESMVPWGVQEARLLGVEHVLRDADAHTASFWNQYDELVPADEAEANAIPIGMLLPGVDSSLNVRHPVACQVLVDAAGREGAAVHRGVRDVTVTAGEPPALSFTDGDGTRHDLKPRLVVGADGRNATIRRQLGIALERQEELHMVAGLLLEGLDIPDERDFLAAEGDLATVLATAMAEDAADRRARRTRFRELMQDDPEALPVMIGAFAGPELSPDDAFDGRLVAELQTVG